MNNNVGGFFGTTPIQSGGFASNGPTMDQATQETLRVASGMPQPIAESMLFGLGIAQWANRPQNPDMFNQPEFIGAYNGLFGQNQNQIGRTNNGTNNNDLRALLNELIQRLGNK